MPCGGTAQAVELKFNPYHDPRNGRFTFAPGGLSIARSAGLVRRRIATANGGAMATAIRQASTASTPELPSSMRTASSTRNFGPTRPTPPMGRGSNIRAFEKPMTLEQVFPGLRDAPGGAIVAVADDFFDFTGPANETQMALAALASQRIKEQIKQLDPKWHYDELGPNQTVEGQYNKLNDLRFHLAATRLRVKGDIELLQAETIRFIQRRTDAAYIQGRALLRAGKLKVRLSEQEALGNFIDREVRKDLRDRFISVGIDWSTNRSIRVNGREYDSSGTDRTYRRPDARVGRLAFDVTLTRKTAITPQVRGFFGADFQPLRVIIIRPSQLGGIYTYAIPRTETKR